MRNASVVAAELQGAAVALILCAAPARAQLPLSPAELRGLHQQAMMTALTPDSVNHSTLYRGLAALTEGDGVQQINLGQSAEGRRLAAFIAGGGSKRVLLWSQAHGDAEVGTMVLADLLGFLASGDGDDGDGGGAGSELATLLRDSLTVVALPMVNPDGSETGSRPNSHGVDILLDGRRTTTPEGRTLIRAAAYIANTIAIGLEGGTSIPPTEAAVSLTVPPVRPGAQEEGSRLRGVRIADHLAAALTTQSVGALVRREDAFDARSIPDVLQNDFRSVVVMGLGGAAREEADLRSASFAALLSLLQAVATGALEAETGSAYTDLPLAATPTPTQPADLLIRDARVRVPGLPSIVADVAIAFTDAAVRTGGRVVDVGDLAIPARDTLGDRGLIVAIRREGVTPNVGGGYRLVTGSLADLNVLQRSRTALRTPYTFRGGTMSQPIDHRFPRRAKWFVNLQPPLLTQEVSRHHEDVELALDEVGWTESARPGGTGSARTISAFQLSIGRTLTGSAAVEVMAGMADRWSTRRQRFDDTGIELAHAAAYGGVLVSYEYRYLRIAGGPGFIRRSWRWTTLGPDGSEESGATWSPGVVWESSLALPAGTRWAPELRLQYRSFTDAELGGYGIIPGFPVRQGTFAIGLGTTIRWWDGD